MSETNLLRSAGYLKSVHELHQLPPDGGREVAIAGRSNAGKSSAINAVLARKGLARTSRTPGRTQLYNYFQLAAGWRLHRYIIALPGFAIGASLGALLAGYVSDNPVVLLVAVALLGGAGAWLALSLFRLVAFVSGALGGIFLVDSLWPSFAPGEPDLGAILIAAFVGGTLFVGLMRLWVPVLSSALGAGMAGIGLDLDLGWVLILFGLGPLVQFGVARFLGENAFRRRYPMRR